MANILSAKRIKSFANERPKSLAALVAEHLRQMIFKRELELGEMLSEEKIASSLKVSRTPVREAFTLLQLQGLITILPKRGSFVFSFDANDIEEFIQYRLILETQTAPLALKNNRIKTSAKLYKAIALMKKSFSITDSHDIEEAMAYAEADNMFHNAFFEYCENHYLGQAYEIVAGRFAALRAHLTPLRRIHTRSYSEHVEIAKAFESGDVELVVKILTQHVTQTAVDYTYFLSKNSV